MSVDLEPRPLKLLLDTIEKAKEKEYIKEGDEAIEHWIRAAALARITYGSKDYHYALCHIRAGCCYLELLGLYDQALYHSTEGQHTIESLSSHQRHSPETIHIHANSLCISGQVLTYQGHLPEAERSLLQAERLSDQYSKTPEGKADVLLDMKIAWAMGKLCLKQKKFELSRRCLEKALELLRTLSWKDKYGELNLLKELSNVNLQMSEFITAMSCLNEAEEFSKTNFGPSSEERADVLMKLAAVHLMVIKRGVNSSEENVTQAESLLWDAYGIMSLSKGPANPQAMTTQDELVKLLILTERYEEAVRILKDLIPNKSETYGEGSMEVSRARKVLGSLYLYLGEVGKSSQQLKLVREIFFAVLGPNHKETMEVSKILDTLTGSIDGKKIDLKRPLSG